MFSFILVTCSPRRMKTEEQEAEGHGNQSVNSLLMKAMPLIFRPQIIYNVFGIFIHRGKVCSPARKSEAKEPGEEEWQSLGRHLFIKEIPIIIQP